MSRFLLSLAAFAFAIAAPALADDRAVPTSAAEVRLSFAPLVKKAAPAVVNVYASRVVQQSLSPFFSDPFFRRFFGDDEGFGPPAQRVQRSLGSGVIVDASGIIVTNHHVIANADEIKVALSDRREFDCDVILKDERTDLAILKIRDGGDAFPTLAFSDSDSLEVGDLVLAIGDPFGVGQTVTSGIVSALARTEIGVSDYRFFIQTDAAINPGNSGGALVDMNGGLVGINTAIYSRSGDSSGIGFAIPSNMVRIIVEAAKTGGRVRMPWVGATFQAVTPDIAESLGIDRPAGALVTEVAEASPSARAGLKTGDVVVSIDDHPVADPSALRYRVATKGLGGMASLGIIRTGETLVVAMPLEPAPETVPRDEVAIDGRSPLAGVVALNLSPAVAEELGYDGEPRGVIVSVVAEGTHADRAGLVRGDVILAVNGVEVGSTQALTAICAENHRFWELAIDRKGRLLRQRYRS